MKYILLILLAAHLISCNNTPEDKAQAAVKAFLKKQMAEPSAYEPISFGKIDSLFSNDESGKKYFLGYSLAHTFKAKNSFGDLIRQTDTFLVDPGFQWATDSWASKGKVN